MDNSLEVTIYGRTLNIKSNEENIEYLKEIADFVNESMNDIAEHYGSGYPRDTIAILACLNIADLLKREIANSKAGKDTLSALKESIASRSNELIKLIDETKENK
ncbi:cell division protein ZapA [Brachyspira alvinipulli]|uniref:cell division protein ZapA n=1 Tax=Brachyspira alvinipulli TaxID=84379 RepID=UPI0004845814|nr:cell division protein ZapA [Brachyspira alvinipulli]